MEQRPVVFVVDDEQRMCDSLKGVLGKRGFNVITASSGKKALAAISKTDVDVYLLDICIPDLDGFRLLEAIFARNPAAKVVMMTGDASVDSAVRALRKGAYDYLKKPFEPEEVARTIYNAWQQKQLLEKNRIIENRLKISERRFRFMVHNSPDMVYTLDKKGRFTFINKAVEKLFGYKTTDLIGKPYQTILFNEDVPRARWRFNERRTGKRATTGYEMRLKTGPHKKTANSDPPGYALVELNSTGVYRRTQNNKSKVLVGTYGVARDMTIKKVLETQLLQAKKIEALGNLAGGIAHDFNNLLMGIQGIVSLLLYKMDPGNPYQDQIRLIEQYVEDAAGLTRQLLTFAKGGTLEIKPTDLNALIKKQTRMFGRIHKAIEISENLEFHLAPIEADPSQIEQVLMNIYVNSWHAMPGGGKLNVGTENIQLTEQDVLTRSEQLRAGRYVKVTITDTGTGMDENTLQRIFDPFFTTKQMGKGSGLGLYSAYGIVKNHGGHIRIASKKNVGTAVYIYLPATDKRVMEDEEPSFKKMLGRETILLVDDEEKIRQVFKESLKLLGYSVIAADSGEQAIDIYRENSDNIDIIMLDMIMPGLSGKETYRELREIDPRCRVLLSSGYSLEGEESEILQDDRNSFIQKPFKIEKLSATIREMLEGDN